MRASERPQWLTQKPKDFADMLFLCTYHTVVIYYHFLARGYMFL